MLIFEIVSLKHMARKYAYPLDYLLQVASMNPNIFRGKTMLLAVGYVFLLESAIAADQHEGLKHQRSSTIQESLFLCVFEQHCYEQLQASVE
jgi:hypothetical protein